MSDLPSATIALAELALLALAGGRGSAIGAGVLAGMLVWLRTPNLLLVGAAVAGLSADRDVRRRLPAYVAGLLPLLVLLGLWQWRFYGSPLATSYQATATGVTGSGSELSSFFSLAYIFGPPWNTYSAGTDSNASVYARAMLFGYDNPYIVPGVGLVGLVTAAVLARRGGVEGIVGRFALAASALTLVLYLPYFYRDTRFLIIPTVLNDVLAAVLLAHVFSRARALLPTRRPRAA